jgi:hypothetical protein
MPAIQLQPRRARAGFALIIALLALVPAAKAVLYDTLDPDSFIHLLAADQMSREGIGPIVDSQSYMSVREPWTPYSWLAEFGMKFVWDHGGYRAAVACHAIMAAGMVCVFAVACATRVGDEHGHFLRVAVATAFAAFLTIPYLSFRPVTAAMLVMAVIVWLLVRDRAAGERSRAVWLVVPLTALLINLHLYAIIVPAWLLALWAGALWERSRRSIVRYGFLMIATAIACTATPMLPGVIGSIAFYQAADPMVAGSEVKEYLPFYAGTAGKIAAALVIIMLGFAVARRRELRAGEVFWLLGSVVLLMRMGRFSPVFAMAAAPIVAATRPRLSDRILARRFAQFAVGAVLALGLLRLAFEFPRRHVTFDQWLERNGPSVPGYPAAAAAFVEARVSPRTGRLINEYTWGGYLSWRLGPQFKVLLDGRTNLFTPAFWQKIYLGGPDEQAQFLASINADAAIVPAEGSRFATALKEQGWTTAHADPRAIVLVPPTARSSQASSW